jgi:hypothetical protein
VLLVIAGRIKWCVPYCLIYVPTNLLNLTGNLSFYLHRIEGVMNKKMPQVPPSKQEEFLSAKSPSEFISKVSEPRVFFGKKRGVFLEVVLWFRNLA